MMASDRGDQPITDSTTVGYFLKALFVVTLFYLVFTPLVFSVWVSDMPEDYKEDGLGAGELSRAVFEEYGVPFFMLGFLMVAAIVGGMYLAKDELRTRRWGK